MVVDFQGLDISIDSLKLIFQHADETPWFFIVGKMIT